jgi:hypothetical protein
VLDSQAPPPDQSRWRPHLVIVRKPATVDGMGACASCAATPTWALSPPMWPRSTTSCFGAMSDRRRLELSQNLRVLVDVGDRTEDPLLNHDGAASLLS